MSPLCCNALVQLNPYGQDAVRLAVDLANDPPSSLDDLVDRCRPAGVALGMPVGEADLRATLALVDQWCLVVDAAGDDERADLLNALLAEAATHPRLVDHDSDGWHLHYRDDGVSLSQVLRTLVSVGTALHLAGRGMHRIGRCALSDCHRVYADTSRTGRQRYCSPGCANRAGVRRHRAGRRPSG